MVQLRLVVINMISHHFAMMWQTKKANQTSPNGVIAVRVNPPSSSGHALPVRPSVRTRDGAENVKIDVKSGSAQLLIP